MANIIKKLFKLPKIIIIRPKFLFYFLFDIKPSFFKENNIKIIFFDLDNTLATRSCNEPTIDAINWIKNLKDNDIKAYIISNTIHSERIEKFVSKLEINGVAKAGKPNTRIFINILEQEKISPENSLVVGDQLITDILAGYELKAQTMLVYPFYKTDYAKKHIDNIKEPFVFKMIQLVESIILKIKGLKYNQTQDFKDIL